MSGGPTLRSQISRRVSRLFGLYTFSVLAVAWLAITTAALIHAVAQADQEKTLVAVQLRSELRDIHARLAALSRSSVLWTGLTDSLGRDAYMLPLLRETNQASAVRYAVLDYRGRHVTGSVVPGLAPDTYLPLVTQVLEQRQTLLRPVPRAGREGAIVLVAPILSPQSEYPVGAIMASHEPFSMLDDAHGGTVPHAAVEIRAGAAMIGRGQAGFLPLARTEGIELAPGLGLELRYASPLGPLLGGLALLLAAAIGLTVAGQRVARRRSERLAGRLTQRLDHLVQVCDDIARGERAMPAEDHHDDEISRLSNSLRAALVEQQDLADRLRPVARVFETSAQAIFVSSPAGEILDVNPALVKMTGYARAQLLGRPAGMLYRDQTPPAQAEAIRRSLREEGGWRDETSIRCANGEVIPVIYSVARFRDEAGIDRGYVTTLSDISEIKETQRQLQDMALTDALTGLPNFRAFAQHIRAVLERYAVERAEFVLLFIDLDRLKAINESYGHEGGDEVIRQVADYLRQHLPASAYLCRRSGDEFIGVIERYPSFELLQRQLDALFRQSAVPMQLSTGETTYASFSVGALRCGGRLARLKDLLVDAGNALQAAKEGGRAQLCWHSPELGERRKRRLRVEQRLRGAIDQGDIVPFYQPEVDLRSGEVVLFEALARWQDPELGAVSPGEFVPVAEETGLIAGLTELMFRKVVADLPAIRERFPRAKVALNTSPGLLLKNRMFLLLTELAAASPALCGALEVEITESQLADVTPEFMAQLRAIIGLGVQVAIDDFGTGYSSLSRLAAMPVHRLKVDASFVSRIHQENYRRVVQSILGLSRALQLETTAEGVETEAQRDALLALGCRIGQGWLYAKALPLAELMALPVRLGRPAMLAEVAEE